MAPNGFPRLSGLQNGHLDFFGFQKRIFQFQRNRLFGISRLPKRVVSVSSSQIGFQAGSQTGLSVIAVVSIFVTVANGFLQSCRFPRLWANGLFCLFRIPLRYRTVAGFSLSGYPVAEQTCFRNGFPGFPVSGQSGSFCIPGHHGYLAPCELNPPETCFKSVVLES